MPRITRSAKEEETDADAAAAESVDADANAGGEGGDATTSPVDDGAAATDDVPALPPIKTEEDEDKMDTDIGREEGSPDDGKEEDEANRKSPSILKAGSPTKTGGASTANDFRGGQESWNAMLYQLLLYKAQRGDLNIPHNDTSYRLLYNWVQTQRKHYNLYQENKTSSTFLNADRIAVLDAIDFQWNIRGDTFWQKNFDSLLAYKNENGDVRVPRLYAKNQKLGEWVTDQRRQWKAKMEGKPNMMTDDRKAKLDELGFVWKVRDRADWNDRYEQLLEFKKENGHCIVPQHYTRNRALGKWVAKQREQYRFYREGKHSFLTEERIDLLKSVGFVWQIKGRGAKKNQQAKEAAAKIAASMMPALPSGGLMDLSDNTKSLAKMEEEEKEKMDEIESFKKRASTTGSSAAAVSAAASLGGMPMSVDGEEIGKRKSPPAATEADVSSSLPPIQKRTMLNEVDAAFSHQQLLQANMAAIAAHAQGNTSIVSNLAAALTGAQGGDANALALLRAQLGNDKGFLDGSHQI